MTKEEKCSITQKGRIVVYKRNCEKRIYKEELKEYLDKGWCRGYSESHRKKISELHKGKSTSNKGQACSEDKKIKISQTLKNKYKDNSFKSKTGWSKYWESEHHAWNKGLTKETDSRVKKISNSKIGHEVSQEARSKMSQKLRGRKVIGEKLLIQLSKQYITKKKNNSFNQSDRENKFYNYLCEENKNTTIYKQYKSDKYPFYCDFYIKEKDLYIECNFHWTHGGHPFDKSDPQDMKTLDEWREKAKTSQFYKNAIETWTIRDVKKLECLRKNKLNFKIIYDKVEITQ